MQLLLNAIVYMMLIILMPLVAVAAFIITFWAFVIQLGDNTCDLLDRLEGNIRFT